LLRLKRKIEAKSACLGVIGLGYVGLPLAVEFARAGFRVIGFDVDASKVAELARGRSYVGDVPDRELRAVRDRLVATTDFGHLAAVDSVNICVPTPLRKTRDPDVSYIVAAVEEIKKRLHRDQLVILESTTYPGTTDELILPMLEATGLVVGKDFFLAFSPERVDPGNPRFQTRNIPKVVGGVTPKCTELAKALYSQTLDTVIPVSSTRVAEMVKLLENTFRSVNIGLVNELALMCDKMGIDVWEVIDAAATKPFGFMPFYPGPGLGGHCIPIDPFYLSWKAKQDGFEARFIELAGQVNSAMPHYVVTKAMEALNERRKSLKGSRILILGVTYKADIDDTRESPAIDIYKLLAARGARVSFHDPFVRDLHLGHGGEAVVKGTRLTPALLRAADCTIIVTAHKSVNYKSVVKNSPLILDTRNALKGVRGDHIVRL
jgi:UDP-N-acetyl-D-glucosamine dehydrogenase